MHMPSSLHIKSLPQLSPCETQLLIDTKTTDLPDNVLWEILGSATARKFKINPQCLAEALAEIQKTHTSYQKFGGHFQTFLHPPGDSSVSYKFSGLASPLHSQPMSQNLLHLYEYLTRAISAPPGTFNSALINAYTAGSQYISAHRDRKHGCESEPDYVAMVCLGYERDLKFTAYDPKRRQTIQRTVKLEHGSILIFNKLLNQHFKHERVPNKTLTPNKNHHSKHDFFSASFTLRFV